MREYFLNSKELLDENALGVLNREEIPGLLPCQAIKWNDRLQLLYFVDGLMTL